MLDIGRPEKLVLAVIAVAMAVGTAGWLVGILRPAAADKMVPMDLSNPRRSGAGETTQETMIVVHVSGAVARPGVYRLAHGSRVCDAIEQAGGPSGDAHPDTLNLAALLTDGERIEVPTRSDTTDPVTQSEAPQGTGGLPPAQQPSPGPTRRVNINTASAQKLDTLPGIGPSIAARIIEYRQQNGPFRSIDQLLEVPGIGPKKLEAIRDLVTLQ